MKSDIAKAVQEQVFEFETLMADLQGQQASVSTDNIVVNLEHALISLPFETVRPHEDPRRQEVREAAHEGAAAEAGAPSQVALARQHQPRLRVRGHQAPANEPAD